MMKVLLIAALCLWASSDALPQSRVVGGKPIDISKAPYQVLILVDWEYSCGGSIISKNIILTAAHCTATYENPDDVLVVAGTTDRENLNGDHIYTIKGVVTHPDYDPKTVNNDIGLILLHGEIDFSLEDVKMIDLGTEPVPEGAKMILTGWGRLSASNPEKPKILQSLEVTAISSEVCSAQWGDFFHGNQICAFDKDQGSCHGDSGGPLVYKSVQVGIVSLGKPCALDKADVYTEVAKFLEFINGHIENNNALLY